MEMSGPNSWKDQFVISFRAKTAVNTESKIIVDLSISPFSILSLESKGHNWLSCKHSISESHIYFQW